jgi:hypothetical protein
MDDYNFDALLEQNQIHAGILFPRQAWVDTGGYPEHFGQGREDWAFNVALGAAGYCGVHVKQYGYLYRREGQNRSLLNTTPEHRARFGRMIRDTFPYLFVKGGRPVGCCGGSGPRRVTNPLQNGKAITMTTPTIDNMVLLTYVGDQQLSTYTGHKSGTLYRFGGAPPHAPRPFPQRV